MVELQFKNVAGICDRNVIEIKYNHLENTSKLRPSRHYLNQMIEVYITNNDIYQNRVPPDSLRDHIYCSILINVLPEFNHEVPENSD